MQQHFNKVTCFGSGFVGTPTMAVMALKNPNVKFYIYDINKALIEKWNAGCPIYEEGLEDLVNKVRNVNLYFISDEKTALEDVDVVYIAVPTPTKQFGDGKDKAYDLSYIESVARTVSYFFKNQELKKEIIVLEKSTVPVFTHKAVTAILKENQTIESNKDKFVVISNPEFLAEGTIIENLLHPDRIVYGSCNRADVIEKLCSLHPHVDRERIISASTISAEMCKLVSNCFLAQRISSINSISLMIQKIGGDIRQIKRCVGADTRIGDKFINCSVGFGGSCFRKDLLALIYLAETQGLNQVADYWYQVVKMNEYRKQRFFKIILEKMHNTIRNKKFAVFGLSFKKGTNDVRDSASAKICELLLEEGAVVQIYDPLITRQKFIEELNYQGLWKDSFNNRLIECKTADEATNDTHAIVILTEWDEFIDLDYKSFYAKMHKPSYIFDGRNILKEEELKSIGFKYYRIGQKIE